MSEAKEKAEALVKKKNPFTLCYFKAGWSKTRTEKNNTKYWEWEIKYNGFKCP